MAVRYLVNCKGVFQGGGCKAISFIGAYRAALQEGVGFSEFAGTSAGAIVAALAAAGSTPDQMQDFAKSQEFQTILLDFDFRKLLGSMSWKEKFVCFGAPWVFKDVKGISHKHRNIAIKGIARLLDDLGVFDSSIIRNVIDGQLRKLLHMNTEVRFNDLKHPLTVVATDIRNREVKVWSCTKTPMESVAYAVQCSCTIPGFFKPVDGCYVDGGLLSNLPIIVYPEKEGDYGHLLAFTFAHDDMPRSIMNILDWCKSLMNTSIQGATKLQKSNRNKLITIPVRTPLKLLDFENLVKNRSLVDVAIAEGERAFSEFNELREVAQFNNVEESYQNKAQVRAQVAVYSFQRHDKIVVSQPSLKWCWELFLVVWKWRQDLTEVIVYTECEHLKSPGEKVREPEESRLRMLNHMGITVRVLSQPIPIYGYFFMRKQRWKGITLNIITEKNVNGSDMRTKTDGFALHALVGLLEKIPYTEYPALTESSLLLRKATSDEIIRPLRENVSMYGKAKISIKDVQVKDVFFMTRYVMGYKYRSIDTLYNAYQNAKLPPFSPASINLSNGKQSIVAPPVVEEHDGKMVVIEGNTRFLYAYRNGITTIKAVVVRKVNIPTISPKRFTPDEVSISDMDVEGKTRYGDSWTQQNYFNGFRPIESAVRPPSKYLK